MRFFLIFIAVCSLACPVRAQEDTTVLILDDLQFDVNSVQVKEDTAIVDLFVISSLLREREFKMNTFASLVVDAKDHEHLYTTIQMGRVTIHIDDRQNYLHHILAQDVPIPLRFKIANWKSEYGKPQAVKIVFEDSREPGRYRELKVRF